MSVSEPRTDSRQICDCVSRRSGHRAFRADGQRLPMTERRSSQSTPETAPAIAGDGGEVVDAMSSRVAGIDTSNGGERSGDDTRKRGWFWHWNAIVTQFAPLVGLKGVGLLNSYTVWTDRREESPHRGYAFPSQQSEADFYGEDRAELIAINKILVSLDLIEIRKEMVLRTDEAGRRWRVPHNFYRVKDRDDGFSLTPDAVRKIVLLAEKDRTVYRYVRHIFSPRFSPIDPNNIWFEILEELRPMPAWQKLAAKTEADEARASARTKAGHQARKKKTDHLTPVSPIATATTRNDSDDVAIDSPHETIVAATNKGLAVDVELTNTGSTVESVASVDPTNVAGPTVVAQSNRTYYQENTTTTTERNQNENSLATNERHPARNQASTGPGGLEAPVDVPSRERALRAFEEANGRPATKAETRILTEIAALFDQTAIDQGAIDRPNGWSWVAAAIYEAVEAGSQFVAPRRVREIMKRWQRDGYPTLEQSKAATKAERNELPSVDYSLGATLDFKLPHGHGSRQTWEHVVRSLARSIEPERLARLVDGTEIVRYLNGEVIVAAPTPGQAAPLSGEYRELVQRKLAAAMNRSVRLGVVVQGGELAQDEYLDTTTIPFESIEPRSEETVPTLGMSLSQCWETILTELRRSDQVDVASFETWLRPTRLASIHPDGTVFVTAPNAAILRRVESRFAHLLERELSALTGEAMLIRFVTESALPEMVAELVEDHDGGMRSAV